MTGDAVRLKPLLAVLSVASFMAVLDMFIVNVAFTDIGQHFRNESVANLSWVLNAYTIVFASLLVPLGRLADRYGRKAGFLLGILLFTAASQTCAVSTSLWMLVASRLLQAVGAAALIPTSLGLLLSVFPQERRPGAVRVWSATSALAAAAGPPLGGLLVEVSWRWVFEINVPLGVGVALTAAWLVPDSRERNSAGLPDLLGAGLLAGATGLLSLGLVKLNDWPVTQTTATVTVALVLLVAFWFRSTHHRAPVIEPQLLTVRPYAWANVTILLFSVAFAANLLSTVMWLEGPWHWSAIRTGLAIAPGALMVPVTAALAGRWGVQIRPGIIVAAGCTLCGLGVMSMAVQVGQTPDYASQILPAWLVGGAGTGLVLPTILSASAVQLPPARFATGSAVVNMSQRIGTVLGVSLLVAMLGTPDGYADTHRAFIRIWFLIVAFSAVAALTAQGMNERVSRKTVRPEHKTASTASL